MNSLNATVLMAPALNPSRAESGVGLQPSYEAWVIYNFLSLCMAYVGGPGQVLVHMEGQETIQGSIRSQSAARGVRITVDDCSRWETNRRVISVENWDMDGSIARRRSAVSAKDTGIQFVIAC